MADAHSTHSSGEPPDVRDEAADTPMWFPIVGLALLTLAALGLVWHVMSTPHEAPAVAPAAEPAEGAPAEAPAEAPPPAPAE